MLCFCWRTLYYIHKRIPLKAVSSKLSIILLLLIPVLYLSQCQPLARSINRSLSLARRCDRVRNRYRNLSTICRYICRLSP